MFRRYPYFTWVDLTGGEIFLRRDLGEIVRRIDSRSGRLEYLHFPTNALCANTGERIREIRELTDAHLVITVSVDGPPELNNTIRGVPGAFEKAAVLLRQLHEASLPRTEVYAGMTLIEENSGAVDATVDALREHVPGFNRGMLHVNVAHRSSFYHNSNTGLGMPSERSSVLPRPRLSIFGMVERAYRRLYRRFERTGRCPLPCRSGEVSVYLDSTGRLFPCTMWDCEGVELREHELDIRRALATDEFRFLGKQIRNEECDHCWTPCEAYQTLLATCPGPRLLGRLMKP